MTRLMRLNDTYTSVDAGTHSALALSAKLLEKQKSILLPSLDMCICM